MGGTVVTDGAPDPSDGPDDGEGERFDVRLVRAIARTLDRDPLDLPPLAREVDLEALSALAGNGRTAVSFEYEGCEVEIGPAGDVSVAPPDEARSGDGAAPPAEDADAA